jgi:hypothetical protein
VARGVLRQAEFHSPGRLYANSFESRLIARLGQMRFSRRAIFEYMRTWNFRKVRTLAQVQYHLGAHRVSLREQRSVIDMEVPRMVRLKQA